MAKLRERLLHGWELSSEKTKIGEISEAHLEDTVDRNMKGTLFKLHGALPLLADGVSILLTGSTAAARATAGFSVYSASKAAVHALARSWMINLKGRNVRVNTLVHGPTKTSGLAGLAGPDEVNQRALFDQMALGVPMARVGDTAEIEQAALFLASDGFSFVTGSELLVDGREGHA